MSGDSDGTTAQELGAALQAGLVARLKAIPEGMVSTTARRSGINLRALLRLRAGSNTNITLTTLAKLAVGLGESPAKILTTPMTVPAHPAEASVDRRLVRKAVRLYEEMGDVFEELDGKSPIPRGRKS